MSDKFFYPHKAVVSMEYGQDQTTGEIYVRKIYDGIAGYQKPSNGAMKLGIQYTEDALLVIPVTNIIFESGDKVVVTVENGKTYSATIDNFETSLESGVEGTTLYLKLSQ